MNSKRVTSQDVARLAGVSRTTVSLVLNNVQGVKISPSTRQRVFNAARSLGYVPNAAARALASRRMQIIGLILARHPDQIASDGFIPHLLEGLFDTIRHHDLRLLVDIVEPEHQERAYLNLVRAKRIDGLLLSGPLMDDQALKVLEEIEFPIVIIGQTPDTSLCSVDIDNESSAYDAVSHLIELGHKKIACITQAPPSYSAAVDRLRGYQHALEDNSIPYDPKLTRFGNFTIESGYQQMVSLINSGSEFSAIFTASDTLALGVKKALKESGLNIPENLALVGFDDLPFARFIDPPLTTIHLPTKALAATAVKNLIKIMHGEQFENNRFILKTELIVRDSSGTKHF